MAQKSQMVGYTEAKQYLEKILKQTKIPNKQKREQSNKKSRNSKTNIICDYLKRQNSN